MVKHRTNVKFTDSPNHQHEKAPPSLSRMTLRVSTRIDRLFLSSLSKGWLIECGKSHRSGHLCSGNGSEFIHNYRYSL